MGKANLRITNKKALSPIFATLIILAVVTVLFIPVFIWATGMTSSNQESWQQSGITATERIVVEEASFNATDPTVLTPPPPYPSLQNCTVYLRNIGETAVTINNVIITSPNGAAHPFVKTSPTPYQLTTWAPGTNNPLTSIVKGDLIEIRIPRLNCTDNNFRIVSGNTYTIKVFTTRGVSDSFQIVA